MLLELVPTYDSRKSFYGKARVEVLEDGNIMNLWSYNTLVATIKNSTLEVFGWFSNTTGRHIKEFLLQNGYRALNKKQILEDYYFGDRNDVL